MIINCNMDSGELFCGSNMRKLLRKIQRNNMKKGAVIMYGMDMPRMRLKLLCVGKRRELWRVADKNKVKRINCVNIT